MVAAELPIDRNKYLLWSGIIGIVVYALLLLSGLAFSPHTATGVMMVMAALVAGLIFFQARRVYVHDQELSGQSVPADVQYGGHLGSG